MSIKELAKELKLPYIYENYEELIKEATDLKQTPEEFLIYFLQKEVDRRKDNGKARRIRYAKFPHKKYLVDFHTENFSKELRLKVKELSTLDFIRNKENLILIGNPGTGKTHFAIALGIEACMQGMSVLFTSIPNLVIELKEAMSKNQITMYKRKFEKYDLVILDELGYVSFDKEGNEILFNLLSNRNDNGSIIITSNLVFERWDEVFKDPVLTGALVDRLAHKAHVLDMSGESYRIKETMEWMS